MQGSLDLSSAVRAAVELMQTANLIAMLKDYGAQIPDFTESVGADFARGHKEATGGIILKVGLLLFLYFYIRLMRHLACTSAIRLQDSQVADQDRNTLASYWTSLG